MEYLNLNHSQFKLKKEKVVQSSIDFFPIFPQFFLRISISLMGSSDSKSEQNNQPIQPSQQKSKGVSTPRKSPKGSNSPSPRLKPQPSGFNTGKKANHYNESNIQPGDQAAIFPQIEDPVEQLPTFFSNWDEKFQKEGKTQVKITILTINPSHEIKNLQKKTSQHFGQITWEYQYKKNTENKKQLYLRFQLNEQGGYSLNFLIDEYAQCVEGDNDIWKVIGPLRLDNQIQKIGGFLCQRLYQSNEANVLQQQLQIDDQLFNKWGQKKPVNPQNMKRLIKQKQKYQKLKKQDGFQYTEVSRYFTATNEWVFSVLIQEKHNRFKSWVIQKKSNQTGEVNKLMSSTLKNDIQTRQQMYIQQMKKKREVMREK